MSRRRATPQEFSTCYDGLGLADAYGDGLVAYCQYLDLLYSEDASCASAFDATCADASAAPVLAARGFVRATEATRTAARERRRWTSAGDAPADSDALESFSTAELLYPMAQCV